MSNRTYARCIAESAALTSVICVALTAALAAIL